MMLAECMALHATVHNQCYRHPLFPLSQKYKGIWNCLAILTRALGGNYVNFGVFELYGDPALKVSSQLWRA